MKGVMLRRLVASLLLLLAHGISFLPSESARSGRHQRARGHTTPSTSFCSLLCSHDSSDTASSSSTSSTIRSSLGPFAFRSFPSTCRSWLVQQAVLRNVTAAEGDVATVALASRALTRLRSEDSSSATTTTTTDRSPSVLLRLREEATTTTSTAPAKDEEEEQVSPPPTTKNQTSNNLTIHTYTDSRGRLWKALNTPRGKFRSFLDYHKLRAVAPDEIYTEETTTHVDASLTSRRRKEWRALWQEGRLLTERTEYLAVYPSDSGGGATTSATGRPTQKRGGFGDLLHLYTQRLLSILKDEQEDKRSMIRWLERSYGREATNSIQASELDKLAPEEQMSRLRDFLQWFRGEFPYYYDRCSQCGASVREDVANNNEEQEHSDAADGDEKGHKTFLGYVYPAKTELKGKASRTELYKCHECSHYTRFPRYNAAWHVMEHQRGRCGEYSMLVFRMLRALAYETRWVVDWADHVWVEVWLPRASQWVHLDPCEAAVDEKLIYQSWGKKQTYVVGFYAPRELPPAKGGRSRSATSGAESLEQTPLIEDITRTYTTDSIREIRKRRDESAAEVDSSIRQSTADLRMRLETGRYDQNDN